MWRQTSRFGEIRKSASAIICASYYKKYYIQPYEIENFISQNSQILVISNDSSTLKKGEMITQTVQHTISICEKYKLD